MHSALTWLSTADSRMLVKRARLDLVKAEFAMRSADQSYEEHRRELFKFIGIIHERGGLANGRDSRGRWLRIETGNVWGSLSYSWDYVEEPGKPKLTELGNEVVRMMRQEIRIRKRAMICLHMFRALCAQKMPLEVKGVRGIVVNGTTYLMQWEMTRSGWQHLRHLGPLTLLETT